MSELGRPALTFLRSKARSLRPMFYSTAEQSTSLKKQMHSSVTFAQTE
jgi:hypothetical protein